MCFDSVRAIPGDESAYSLIVLFMIYQENLIDILFPVDWCRLVPKVKAYTFDICPISVGDVYLRL